MNVFKVSMRGKNCAKSVLCDLRKALAVHTKNFGANNSYSGAFSDFYGFPSCPISVYRTGDEWRVPKGPQAQRVPREARPVCNHPLRDVWRTLGKEVYNFLDSIQVLWTSIDPVRFAEKEGKAGPLYLWVGVIPSFPDVEIAFRESVFTRSDGPQLLKHVISLDPTADIGSPFTGALGVQIAPRNTPHFEGTGALYLCEGGQSDRVFLLTARHVALPPSAHRNVLYERKRTSQPREDVLILGSKAFSDALEDMMAKIGRELIFINHYKRELAALGEDEDATVAKAREKFQRKLANAGETIVAIDAFYDGITKHWSTLGQRVLGHVVYAPPISGNVVYIGTFRSTLLRKQDFGSRLRLKMHPHPEGHSSFNYPIGGLLQVKGIVEEEEIRQPKSLDANGEECLILIKNGRSTGVTIGRGTGIESFSTSMEIAIYPYSHKDGAFSAPGDSGSIVVDGLGRIVGLLTGGSGKTDSTDKIKKAFPNSYLYPIKT
ncbi:hypothetical protein DFH11DRAFT_1688466 [Phellopilus nigrolimitatus]|nr:hypothetical protein DFH11DRAFT_1688466 [Phellopilus nigrolimitatus]